MTKEQLSVLRKIIYAVETGQQIYGNTNYSDFTEAYANSSLETAITIGAGAWFSVEALKLLKNIYAKAPNLFTESLLYDMNNKDWNYYAISKDSANAKTIVKIISSDVGKQCQDALMDEQLIAYCNQAEQLGVTEPDAQAMVANWIHQGSIIAAKRIIAKTAKPYNLDNLYNACCTDTEPNQVGSYRTRQSKVFQWLKTYMPTGKSTISTTGVTRKMVLDKMRSWIGLSMSDGSHAPIIQIYNSHKPLARGYAMTMEDDYCACTVSACAISLNAVDLFGGTEVGVERYIEDCFKPKGIWVENDDYVPSPADIIVFYWNESRKEVDNTGFASHIGIVEYVENGIIHTIEGNSSGGTVLRKTYEIGQACIRGFATPHYADDAEVDLGFTSDNTTTASQTSPSTANSAPIAGGILRKGSTGTDVKILQTMLIKCGYDCGEWGADGDFGDATASALALYQKIHNINEDGYSVATKSALERSYDNARKTWFPRIMYAVREPKTVMRKGSSKNKLVVAKFEPGTKVEVKSEKTNKAGNLWYKVECGTFTGWIVAKALKY